MLKSDFDINLRKCCKFLDKSVDWYLNSLEFKKKSLERQICDLKREIYFRDALKFLRKANKCLN